MKKSKLLVIVAFCIVGILLFCYIQYNAIHSSRLTVSEVTNIEEFLVEYNISTLYTDDIWYYKLCNTSVLIVDRRNAECRLYVHSSIKAGMDTDGTLKVIVKDRAAISEEDITGEYAAVIECKKAINNIQLTTEKELPV